MMKFALIGCGRIANRHAVQIARTGRLIAACDIVKEKADNLAVRYDARPYYSAEEMIAAGTGADVICVCTPNGLHARHSVLALEAGYHVICEKPMAIHSVDCKKMITASGKSGKELFIIKQNRYNPPVSALKKLIDDGRLGKIYSIQLNCFWNRNHDYYQDSWHGTNDLDGGTLYTQFSHFIDLVIWLNGDIKKAGGFRANLSHQSIIDFEDTGAVSLEFANGSIGTLNYTVNSYQKNMEGSLTLFAENGTVKIGGEYLNKLEYQNIKDYNIPELPEGNQANQYGAYSGSMSNHDKVYDNVIDVLQHNAKATTSALEAMKTVESIEQIYKNTIFI